jgi:hypothetical protein
VPHALCAQLTIRTNCLHLPSGSIHTDIGVELSDEVDKVCKHLMATLEHAEHDKWALDVLDNVLCNLLDSAMVVWARVCTRLYAVVFN